MPSKKLVVIGGPTGVGKTAVAISLAQHFATEIINADSRQVYAELNIGVGRPSPEQLKSIPHHLIGNTSIHHPYSAGQFAKDAIKIINELFGKHDHLILSGGTGLYLRALMEGMDDFPDIPQTLIDHWTREWSEKGIEHLQSTLEKLDPVYSAQVDKHNPMRLIRALSVIDFTGKPFSHFLSGKKANRDFVIIPILLELPRSELYAHINQRVLDMIDAGWLDEAKLLYPYRELKALNTVGYKELFSYLDGNLTLEDAISKIQQSTRNYAKRQLTWWRNQGTWHSFHPGDVNGIIHLINSIN